MQVLVFEERFYRLHTTYKTEELLLCKIAKEEKPPGP